MIAAFPGWRVVLIDRESGGSVALPIVAWELHQEPHATPGGASVVNLEYLVAWYITGEESVPPTRVRQEDLLGYLAPGEEHEGHWGELGDAARRREDEEEERAIARRKST